MLTEVGLQRRPPRWWQRNQRAFGAARSHLAPARSPPRLTPMNRRIIPITPTQQAANGALGMFVDGHRRGDIPQMLVGLSVLQSATAGQVSTAMRAEEAGGRATVAEIETMLASSS